MNRDDAKVFLHAGLLALVLIFAAAALVHAEEAQPKAPARWSCWAVRKAVKLYGEDAVTSMAREAHIPEAEIEKARKCLR